ncbi:hypothetical protein I6E78_09395 [Pseudoalteromonas sp. NZS127]|uniref:hypothetical protein n=1 Tax=unclassified Pseudoalteromonas TaxID=194690 RepID=UPI0018CC8D81|nr:MULTISPECIES: hypothetical protein [unclassified Pseudoalteromonas]MBH0072197.1 hypothetical protein [Pseudoalteromonas sp. NZS127]MBH0092203.1 hypothetical protein [Pseudoalteromonas sp. SCQQ13]
MINNGLNNHSSLATKQVLPVDNANHTLSSKLQHSPLEIAPKLIPELATKLTPELSPKITSDFLSQFSDEKVAQLLQQQLSVLITPAKKANISSYHYSAEELAIRTVITSQQEGLLKNEHSDKLIQRLNKSVTDIQGAYANTSDILFNLGQLGHQQTSFLASSQQRVERALNPYMESLNRTKYEDDDNYLFELSVKTKEGDVINITFNSSQGYDEKTGEAVDSFGISYEVNGDLSEAEHAALTQVMAGVGEMADEFFKVSQYANSRYVPVNQGDMNLDFLADFNHQQLSGFDVSFSTTQNDVLDTGENTLDLSYSIDEASNQQALVFKSESGQNEIDFALDMSTIGAKDTQQMQQYLASLDQSLEDSRVNSTEDSKDSAFGRKGDKTMQQGFELFKGAFASMSSAAERYSSIESLADKQFNDGRAMVADLVDNMITNDPRYQGLGNSTQNSLGAGISKLADFDAKFEFAMDRGDYQPKSNVALSQTTEQQKSGELKGVTQSKNVSSHFDYQNTRPDYYDSEESYNINTAVKNNELVGLDQYQQIDIDKKTYQYNQDKSQYELKMALTEKTTHESNIRLINDIWLENNENSHKMDKKERINEIGEPDDFKNTNHYSHNKLVTLIGDLDKLAQDKDARREYLTQLSQVNFFMDNNK